MKKFTLLLALLGIATGTSARVYNNSNCDIFPPKPLVNGYGPYDYTNPSHQKKLPIVLNAHFDLNVQRLVPNKNHSGDIAYTLTAIPNYHPALYTASRYDREKKLTYKNSYSADCFFKRAIYFQPEDSTTYMLFAMHLQETKRLKLAKKYYEKGLELSPKAAELNYNYALFMLSQGEINKAKQAAKIAYNHGYPLQGLKNKLKALQNK